MTANEASLLAAIAIACAICDSLRPSNRPAAALRGVIESARHEVAVIHQARLHGVGQRHTEHQVTPAAARVFRGSQRHPEIVGRVACFGGRQEIIHEVDVSHERRMPERGIDWICLSASDQRTRTSPAKVGDLRAAGLDRAGAQGRDAAAQRVQNVDRQLLARLCRKIRERSAGGVLGEGLNLGHRRVPFPKSPRQAPTKPSSKVTTIGRSAPAIE
jgi:hypothetical protein